MGEAETAAIVVWYLREIERLRGVLEFYADGGNYVGEKSYVSEVERDGGRRAREVLRGGGK